MRSSSPRNRSEDRSAGRSALILDGLCLHVLSSFQRTGRFALPGDISRQGNLANLQQPTYAVNTFSGDQRPPSTYFRRRDDQPENFPTDGVCARAELELRGARTVNAARTIRNC
jgi:hypothetical protein